MGDTSIEWTDKTWNPVTGCTKVSPGCKHCYAERVFPRTAASQRVPIIMNGRDPDPANDAHFRQRVFTDVWTHENRLEQPLHWRKPARIFVNSMSDLFHEDVPFEFIDKAFAVMALCPRHAFQILTKRPERMREYCSRRPNAGESQFVSFRGYGSTALLWQRPDLQPWPLKNVWLGVSVENQQYADERIPLLLQTPAAVRFVSYEPALGPADFAHMDVDATGHKDWGQINALTGRHTDMGRPCADVPHLDWIIVGGESGPGARPFNIQWARDIVAQCKEAGVACFVKQLGAKPEETVEAPSDGHKWNRAIPLNNRKGGDWNEWLEDLRVREFPAVEVKPREHG